MYFSTNSLFHLNIISSFIIYFFLTTTHHSTFFYSIVDYYNRKKSFEEWTVAHQTWWATIHEPKKFPVIENLLETLFMVLFSIIENILPLRIPLEMLWREALMKTLGILFLKNVIAMSCLRSILISSSIYFAGKLFIKIVFHIF